jgi:hypothetical protein
MLLCHEAQESFTPGEIILLAGCCWLDIEQLRRFGNRTEAGVCPYVCEPYICTYIIASAGKHSAKLPDGGSVSDDPIRP